MQSAIIRIQEAEIKHLQNVEQGKIRFACNYSDNICVQKSDILGIYGQNGSGKTTFINALDLLKMALSGEQFDKDLAGLIMQGQPFATLSFVFSVCLEEKQYKVNYNFDLGVIKEDSRLDILNQVNSEKIVILKEKLQYSYAIDGVWQPLVKLFETKLLDNKVLFNPKKYLNFLVKNKNIIETLTVTKKLALKQGTSFLFAKETMRALAEIKKEDFRILGELLKHLSNYGKQNLYVIGTRGWGPINMNVGLPIYFKVKKQDKVAMGAAFFRLDDINVFPELVYETVNEAIIVLDNVLCQIIPGLHVELHKIGQKTLQDGSIGFLVELVSVRNNKRLPLRYESEGVKKIVAILNMLVATYNNKSMTLAIDELDAGIFEYLLGELLQIFAQSGKGQLIFTSHNLRPLEILDKYSIVFTTTNPEKRYIRLSNVKTNNNLRDFYYRDIALGGQSESIYDVTNNFEIAHAMRKAGVEVDG